MAKSKVEKWLTPEGLTLLNGWARDGLTDEQIAKNMQISTSTYYDYRKKYVEISEALKKGKEIIDYEVEDSLLKKCFGYNAKVKKNVKVKRVEYNDDGYKSNEYEEIIEVYDEVHVPADTTAQIFWLKNRKPEKWREKQESINNNDDEGVTIIDDLPKSEGN